MGNKFSSEYEKGQPLGKGGQGEVFKCLHKDSKEEFAVKIIKIKDSSQEDIERFEKEAETLKMLPHHPNVVKFVNYYRESKKHYLVMDFASDGDLSKFIELRKG